MSRMTMVTHLFRSGRWIALAGAVSIGFGAWVGGCGKSGGASTSTQRKVDVSTDGQTQGSERSPSAVITPTDTCATQMHEICGPLLTYYALNRRLPSELEELLHVPGAPKNLSFTCPVSSKPYVYFPNGIMVIHQQSRSRDTAPEFRGHIILVDPEPSHQGYHWGIAIDEPKEGRPFLTKVVAVDPERLRAATR